MNIKEIKLKKRMTNEEVNVFALNWVELLDDIYLGNNYRHKWKCKCGEIFNRKWMHIRIRDSLHCDKCKYEEVENRYRKLVESVEGYEYIRSFRMGEKIPS
ncbi:MAG: hypothetical protein ACRCX8_05075 [Sarcina sp.]